MSGLLGDGWDDPQSQMMMGLAQGLLSARGGQGLAAGLGNMQAVQQNIGKKKLMDMQLANYQSEIDARKLATIKDQRQQAIDAQFMGTGGGSGEYASNQSAGGAPSVGQGGEGFTAAGIAKQFGLPIEAVISDYKFNGGKKIAELIDGRSKPNWQNINGNLVNTNAQGFGGGLQGGMSASADGKVTAWQPDGSGGLVVGAPRGAMETYGAYKGVDAGLGAAARINLRKNADGTESPVSELTENPTLLGMIVGRPPGGAMPNRTGNPMIDAVAQTESGGNPNAVSPKGARGLMQVMPGTNTAPGFGVAPARDNSEAERTRVGRDYHGAMMERYKDPALAAIAYNWGPGNTDMWLKGGGDYSKLPKETQSYVSQVLTRNGVNGRSNPAATAPPSAAPAAAPAYGMTNEQVIANKAKEEAVVGKVKADVVRDTSKQQAGKLYGQLTAGVDRAIELLNQGPTASGAGAMADSAANFFGKSTKGADIASQLDTISGWMTANVPRMEGPQSDKDVIQYKLMAGAVGDRTKPISQRLAAAQELKTLQAKYADLNGVTLNTGGASGSWGDKSTDTPKATQTFDAKPPAHQFKGKIATGPDGKRYQSDGLIWKEVK